MLRDRDGTEAAAALEAAGLVGLTRAVADGGQGADLHAGVALAEALGSVPDGLDALLASEQPSDDRARWLLTAAWAASAALAATERSRAYARAREAFGKPIVAFQSLRHLVVDAVAEATAAQALARLAADSAEAPLAAAAALASLRALWTAADTDMQVHGGMGYSEESDTATAWLAARAVRTGEDDLLDAVGAALGTGGGLAVPSRWDEQPYADQRAAMRAFLDEHVRGELEEWEAAREFPRALFRAAGDAGMLGHRFPADVGGSGPDLALRALWIDELARCGSGGIGADLGASIDLAAVYVHRAGSPEQHERWLRPTLAGELIGALAITEPGAGSDVAGITTRARRTPDGWRIDGDKVFITNGSWADYVVTAAKVSPDDGGGDGAHAQVTLFVVPGDAAGLERRRLRMVGWNLSHTGELHLDGVTVGDEARLGEIGTGFLQIVQNFAWERLTMSLGAVAAAEEAQRTLLELAGSSARWRDRAADLAVRVAAARALTEVATGVTLERPDDAETLGMAALSKLLTQRLAVDATDLALAAAEATGAPDEVRRTRLRWLRDARLGPIGGGTDQIMRDIISRSW